MTTKKPPRRGDLDEKLVFTEHELGALERIPLADCELIHLNEFQEGTSKYWQTERKDAWAIGPTAFKKWSAQIGCEVHPKHTYYFTNLTDTGTNREYDHVRSDILWFDCDDVTTPQFLITELNRLGVGWLVYESSSSARDRHPSDESWPTRWHVVLFFSQPFLNPINAWKADSDESQDARAEQKREYRALARYFSALAGVAASPEDGTCAFDLSTDQLCSRRYPGARYDHGSANARVWYSQSNKGFSRADLLREIGYVKGEPQSAKRRQQKVVKIQGPTGVTREFKVTGGGLAEEIRSRITPQQLLAQVMPDVSVRALRAGEAECLCPFHVSRSATRGGAGRYANFAFFSRGGADLWKCRSGCGAGDVIKLAMKLWGLSSYRDAVYSLAKHLNLNPKDYRKRIEDPSLEEEADQTIRVVLGRSRATATGSSSAKRFLASTKGHAVPLPKGKVLEATAAWVEKNVSRFKNRQRDCFLMMIKLILMAQGEAKDVNAIAATLWPTFRGLYDNDRGALFFEVINTYERLRTGQPSIGTGFLKEFVATWERFQLASALRKDGYAYKPMLKALVGCSTTLGVDKEFLNDQWIEHEIDPGRAANPHPKDSDAWKRHERRRVAFKNVYKRPGVCSQCEQVMTGDGGRNLGPSGADGNPTELKRKLVCNTKICLFCSVLQTISESEILGDLWDGKVTDKRPVYVVQGTVEKESYIKTVRDRMSRISEAKLGILGWGDDYKPKFTYFVNDRLAALQVKSMLRGSQSVAAAAEGLTPPKVEISIQKISDIQEAIDLATEARVSFNLHGKRLVEEQKISELQDWLWWAVGKVPVRNPQREDALHWPTRAMVQAQVKAHKGEAWEPDLWPGESMNYSLRHILTQYVLARRAKIPFGIDDAFDHMRNNQGYRHAQAELDAAQGKNVVDLDDHRSPLRGAAVPA
jgi:hypothetical protein